MSARLTKPVHAISVHGTTGQDLDDGTLEAGTLVRRIEEDHDELVGLVVRFQASTDHGITWHDQRSYERLPLRPSETPNTDRAIKQLLETDPVAARQARLDGRRS